MHSFLTLTLTATLYGAPSALALPLKPVPDAFHALPPAQIIPVPQRAQYPQGTLPLAGLTLEVRGTAHELQAAARDLQTEWMTRLNTALPLASGAAGRIVIGTRHDARLAGLARDKGLFTDRPEGYALWVDSGGATVVGADARGAYYGAQTLRQLLTPTGIRFAQVNDFPQLSQRMAMLYLDQYSKGINDALIPLLAGLKYNSVLVMSNYVQWDAAREGGFAHPGGASKAEAARIADLARSYGLEPIPLIETLGHTGWLFHGGANRDLMQDPQSQNPFAYDTLNPRTYDVVLPILTEAVKTFGARRVHIGHDEVRNRDRFPARENGKAQGFVKLFTDDTLRLYRHLKSLGAGTMIWHDVAFADAFREQIPAALPKDIEVMYWAYNPAADYPLLADIKNAGFSTYAAGWRDPMNPESFARSAARSEVTGYVQTRWSGYFGNPSIWDGQADQGVAYVRGAASAWNPAAPPVQNPAARYRDLYRGSSYTPQHGQLVNLTSVVTRPLTDRDETGWIQKGPSTDLSALPSGEVKIGAYRFLISGAVMTRGSRAAVGQLPGRVSLPIGAKADGIAFLHTTGWPHPTDREQVGRYEIEFADGTRQVQPLEYGRHIRAWTEPLVTSMVQAPAWFGTTKDGLDVSLGVLEWRNPAPGKVIKQVTLVSEGRGANPTLLGLTLLGGTR